MIKRIQSIRFHWTIGRKIPVLMVAIAAISCGAVALFASKSSFSTTQTLIAKHLNYIATTRRDILSSKLQALQSEVASLANNPGFGQVFDGLYLGYAGLSAESAKTLSDIRMRSGSLREAAVSGADYYLENYRQAEPWLQNLAGQAGFKTIALIDKKGQLIYSTASHPLGALDVEDVLKSALEKSISQQGPLITGFAPPDIAGGGGAYIAVPIPAPAGRSSNQRAGTLIVGLGTAALDGVLHDTNGFGPHGEAIVVAGDGVLRSTSRFGGADARSIKFGTQSGEANYRGLTMMAASENLIVGDQALTVIALEPRSEMLAPATDLLWKIILLAGTTIFATFLLSHFASRSISRPIVQLVAEMKRLASGVTAGTIEGISRGDEVGDMSRAVLVFKQNALAKETAEQAAKNLELAAQAERGATETERRQRLTTQAAVFEEIGRSLSALAEGVLNRQIEATFPAEYAQLREDFNAAVNQLRETISAVAGQANSMTSIANEMHAGTRELAKRTEQQAVVLENAVRALNNVSSDINRTADAADEADRIVSAVHREASSSDAVVSQAIEGMTQIEESSRQIATIVNVIDEIAFQTNLLALNAGVEASRAGDAGRGFAVVASEVRALAQRSADAATEIKDLIATSSQRVKRGTQLVSSTSDQLKNIASQITHIKSVVSNIAATASDQARHLATIGTTIGEIDQSTQQTAAMAEESTAACHSLDTEAARLLDLIRAFTLDESITPVAIPLNSARQKRSLAI
ncbi:methyl-accepting chemotaxis protein [Metarhizobium album]|uniref:Methyl-accepting chemotaxis protein n=1 Tax=Metarhizobium album TaxID=2182425 RepID=A0A2U2DK81_9HYPH|nr:HAMP domain-containing methyl-accepting chemotaxis protein [Rhizobium album]PWE53717.1 methyl-accepting chemotaxis protein [Rhizobium album]